MELTKGILDYEGLGANKKWVIITEKGEYKNIWTEFSKEIIRLEFVKVQFNKCHINIVSQNKWDNLGNPINKNELEKFLNGLDFSDDYIGKMLLYLDIILRSLNGRNVRIRTFGGSLYIMDSDFFDYLRFIDEETLSGRYKDAYDFCYIHSNHRKRICGFKEKNQCIFAVSFFREDIYKNYVEYCLCGKYSKGFADGQIALFEDGKLGTMRKGSCGFPRGYEF